MINWVPWPVAGAAAAGCAATTFGLERHRAMRSVATWTRELTAMLVLYALWQYAGDLSVSQGGDAVARGRDIWNAERAIHLPNEVAVQRLFLGHHGLIRLSNLYYAQAHVAALGACLIWLFARHRDRYRRVRNVLVHVTGASLLIQLLPVAPPRLVPGLGVVDTGHLIGPSVYPPSVAPGLDQLSAMPSLHMAWAIIVAGSIVYALRSAWRWLALLYPACTGVVVVVTGNHYWADGIVAAGLCGLALMAVGAVAGGRRRRQADRRSDDRPGQRHPDRRQQLISAGSAEAG